MATFKICVFKHQKRTSDDKYPVSIRVTWKRKYAYIKTNYYVTNKQITRDYKLSDPFILSDLNNRIRDYEDIKAKKLGSNIELYTVRELASYFEQESKPGTDTSINFITFARDHISRLRKKGRKGTAATLERTVNALLDFSNGRELQVSEITKKFLEGFEDFLKSERKLKRKDQFGRPTIINKGPVSDVTLTDYMTDVRTLFNAAIDEYNDEDRGDIRIMHYPFRKYKIARPPETESRALTINQIKDICNLTEEQMVLPRTILARDVFMLSFYLAGVNTADLYNAPPKAYRKERFSYERTKTKNRRQDRAFLSIKVEPEAKKLFEKYRDPKGQRLFDFYSRYTNSHIFGSNLNKGLKKVAQLAGIEEDLTTYYARHSWGTIARNDCNVSMDDINLSLNHVNQKMKITDKYVKKDWSRIDNANRMVLDLLDLL